MEMLPSWFTGPSLLEGQAHTHPDAGQLVREYRAACACNDMAGADEALRRLLGVLVPEAGFCGGMVSPMIYAIANSYHLTRDSDIFREFQAECCARLWCELRRQTIETDYWERHFFHALRRLALKVAWTMKRKSQRDERISASLALSSVPSCSTNVESPKADTTYWAIRHAINDLPSRQRQIAYLHFIRQWKIESTDTNERTISGLLGISGRMVRRHLHAARAALQRDPHIRTLWEDRGGAPIGAS